MQDTRYKIRNTRKGFSLAEAMLATVILGIAAAGVLMPFTAGTSIRYEGNRRTLAAKLAADLAEQVIDTPFDQITANYNYTEPAGQLKDASGAVLTDSIYAPLSREVSCNYIYVDGQDETFTPNFIWCSVKVYYNGRETAAVDRLISK